MRHPPLNVGHEGVYVSYPLNDSTVRSLRDSEGRRRGILIAGGLVRRKDNGTDLLSRGPT